MAEQRIHLRLKISVWDFFSKMAKEQNRSIEDIILEFTGLDTFEIDPAKKISISQRDRGVFSAVWSIYSQLTSLEKELIRIQTESRNKTYLIILNPVKLCKNVMDVLISAMDKCVEMPLTETEQNACGDFSLLVTTLHKDIIEHPSYLKRVVRILKKVGLPNIRKLKL